MLPGCRGYDLNILFLTRTYEVSVVQPATNCEHCLLQSMTLQKTVYLTDASATREKSITPDLCQCSLLGVFSATYRFFSKELYDVSIAALSEKKKIPYCKLTYSAHGNSGWSRGATIPDQGGHHWHLTSLRQVSVPLAGEANVPMVSSWMTDGFYGAEVTRIVPGRTGCWNCFATGHRLGEGLRAEAGPPSEVIVQGCSHPTTIGAGFDAAEVAAIATRLAVQTLAPAGGYPDADWDHAALSFRRAPDDAEVPRFQAEALAPRDDCEQCQTSAGVPSTR